MIEVSTSILNIKKGKEAETIFGLERARTDYIHIDVMDGEFVKNNTYEKMFELASYTKRISNLPLDVHLMVKNAEKAIEEYSSLEPNTITFHLEACENEEQIFKIIDLIKQKNCKVGISIKPNTKVEEIYKYLPFIHTVLIMTVEPGKGGQTLIPETVGKIKTLKQYIEDNSLEVDIEADGGINLNTYKQVVDAGTNILVSGVAILMARDYKEIIDTLKGVE